MSIEKITAQKHLRTQKNKKGKSRDKLLRFLSLTNFNKQGKLKKFD